MFIKQQVNWLTFKTEVLSRTMCAQWVDSNDIYTCYGVDGYLLFVCELDQDGGESELDFLVNYKAAWSMRLEYRDKEGIPQIVSSPRPPGTATYYSSQGDNGGVGGGKKLLFNMSAADPVKSVDLEFNEDIYIKDGFVLLNNAPLGARIDIEIAHPVAGVVGRFAKNVFINGFGIVPFNSGDKALIPKGFLLRVFVHNSSGINEEDPPSAFTLVGVIEMYRITTI